MKLTYLGTAAAEGVPALFCRCDFCRYARKAGGREIRTRAGALLDDKSSWTSARIPTSTSWITGWTFP